MLYLVHQCKLILQGSNQKSRHPSRARSWQSNNTERALGKHVEESKREWEQSAAALSLKATG